MLGYPRWRDADPDDTVNSYRNDVADWWMFRFGPMALGLLLLWWLYGCGENPACLPDQIVGTACDEGQAYMLHYSMPTCVRQCAAYPHNLKIGGPYD